MHLPALLISSISKTGSAAALTTEIGKTKYTCDAATLRGTPDLDKLVCIMFPEVRCVCTFQASANAWTVFLDI